MEHEHELLGNNNWRIVSDPTKKPSRIIVNTLNPIPLSDEVYNYSIFTPIVLLPISKSSAFILSATEENGELELRIHDLRLVGDEFTNSVGFLLRGNDFQISKFKNTMNRVADEYRCVGLSFFFRKLFFAGFKTIYADKKLKTKESSTLRATINVISATMTNKDIMEENNG